MAIEFRTWNWGGSTIGWLIAFVVVVLCFVLWFIGRPLTGPETLGLIAAVAASRLL